jgi:hypothetical protein
LLLPFVVIRNERSEEGSLLVFEQFGSYFNKLGGTLGLLVFRGSELQL